VATTVQPYAYCGDDPVNATDPLGESTASPWFVWLGGQPKPVQQFFQCAEVHGLAACAEALNPEINELTRTCGNMFWPTCVPSSAGWTARGAGQWFCAAMQVFSMELCLKQQLFEDTTPVTNVSQVRGNQEDQFDPPDNSVNDDALAEYWQRIKDALDDGPGDG
jgi:hypothetical protein